MKRILFLTTDSRLGGTERTILMLAREIDLARYTPYIAVLKGGGELMDDYRRVSSGVCELTMSPWSFLHDMGTLLRWIDTNHIDIVHSFLFHANMIARCIKAQRPHLVVINAHRTIERGQPWHCFIDRMTKKYVDFETTNAEAVRSFVIRHTRADAQRIVTIYNGVDAPHEAVAVQSRDAYSGVTFGCIANFSAAKGHEVLFNAFARLRRLGAVARLILYGEGPLKREAEAYVRAKGIADLVKFAGKQVVDSDRHHTYDCLVIPSLWEGMPNVLLEALVHRKPVIATDVGGVREVAGTLPTVTIVPSGDVQALIGAMDIFIERSTDSEQLEHVAHAVLRRFSVGNMVRAYEKVYEKIGNESF